MKQQLANITKELYLAGVITPTGGNISVRNADREKTAWITPSQVFKRDLSPDQMVLIDMDGKRIEGDYEPSIESIYHTSIYKNRPDINSVVHSHAPLSIIFGLSDLKWIPITTEAIPLSNLPMIPWYFGGSEELAKAVEKHVSKTKAKGAFLRNHGLITIGENLREAANATLVVEHTIKIMLACKVLGKEPTQIFAESIESLLNYEGVND